MEKHYKLSFGTIIKLNENLAEVIVNEGIAMDEFMIAEYHQFLLNNLIAPFYLLINKKNSYTYTFTAQRNIANLPEIKAMAIVLETTGGLMSTETLFSINENKHSKVRLFNERHLALSWLKSI